MSSVKNLINQRTKELKSLGFNSYDIYIRSALWKAIRAEVLRKRGKQCCCCDDKATQVHHQQYDKATLRGQCIAHLYPICDACHKKTHQRGWMYVFTARLRHDFSRNTLGFNKIVLDDYVHITPKRAKPRNKAKKQEYAAQIREANNKINRLFELVDQLQIDNELLIDKIAELEAMERAF